GIDILQRRHERANNNNTRGRSIGAGKQDLEDTDQKDHPSREQPRKESSTDTLLTSNAGLVLVAVVGLSVFFAVISFDSNKTEQSSSRETTSDDSHFVDTHRTDLIGRISPVEPVLDDLLAHKLLTPEQYNIVLSKGTPQYQMRQLYEYIRSWGVSDKEELYQSLKKHNRPLIRDLEDG
ncbi:uncharacterized protein O3C94_022717, partial [Discoglossus pictus]